MNKKLLAAVLAAALSGSLAACSSGPAASPAGGDDISGTVTMLTPMFSKDADKEAFAKSLEKFKEKYPDVEVKIDYTDFSKLNEKITTGLAGGLLPDVVQLGIGWVPPLASKGVIAPLDDLGITADSIKDDFSSVAVEGSTYEGKLYAMPFTNNILQGMYRKDLFKEAGLDPEKPPTTWDELQDYAKALTVRDTDGKLVRAGFTALTDNLRQNFTTFLFANGGRPFAEDGSKATFNSPEGVEALEFINNLVKEDKVVDPGFESGAPQNPLLSGKAAMGLYLSYVPCDNPAVVQKDICDQFGFFAIPGKQSGERAVMLGGTLSSVTTKAKNPKAAAALVKFMSTEPSAAFSTSAGNFAVPAAKSTWTDPRIEGTPSAKFSVSVLDKSGTEGGPTTWLDTRNDFQPALESVIVGGVEPKTALDALAKKADAAIAAAK